MLSHFLKEATEPLEERSVKQLGSNSLGVRQVSLCAGRSEPRRAHPQVGLLTLPSEASWCLEHGNRSTNDRTRTS